MSHEAKIRFGFAKSATYGLIITIILLIIAEVGLRTWAYFFREQYERYDLESETFVLVPGEHRQGFGVITINSTGFVGEELQSDGPDLFRIVAVGDSCTFGDGDHETAYPALIEKILQANFSDIGRLEVVNAGVEGHNSMMALRRLQHNVAPLRPDVVTIYIGWNDLMKFDPLGQSADGALSAAMRWLDNLWLTKGTRKLLFFYLRPSLYPPLTGRESFRGSFESFVPEVYEENLRAIIQTVYETGAKALLLTLPTVIRPDMSADQLSDAGVVFPYYPSAYAVGDFLDLIAAYNQVIHTVAADTNAELVDLAEAFEDLHPPQAYFYDTMHLNKSGREVAARLIVDHMMEHRMLPSQDPGR